MIADLIPWRIRLAFRSLVTATAYKEQFGAADRFLVGIGAGDARTQLIERAVRGVGPFTFNARCIEARTVPGTWEQVLRMLPKDKIKTLADIGCGNENPGHAIERLGISVEYSDIEPFTHIENFTQMNFNEGIRYPDAKFDYAVSIDVIEHLENTREFCRELRRISRLGFIVATPNPLSKRSLRTLRRTGYFEWYGKNELSWHINPVFHFQMSTIAEELGMSLEMSGNTCFFKDHNAIDYAEAMIYKFSVV